MLTACSLPEHFLFSLSHFSVRWKTFGKIHLRDTRKCYLQIWPLYLQDNFQQVFLITLNRGSNNKSFSITSTIHVILIKGIFLSFVHDMEGNVVKHGMNAILDWYATHSLNMILRALFWSFLVWPWNDKVLDAERFIKRNFQPTNSEVICEWVEW